MYIVVDSLLTCKATGFVRCGSTNPATTGHLASPSPSPPPRYAELSTSVQQSNALPRKKLHPRVAVLLGVNDRWHLPLLIFRALATAPAVWWGLRCAFTFLAELLLSDGTSILQGQAWTIEKQFRVTEVFLAIVWVCNNPPLEGSTVLVSSPMES